MSEQIYFDYEGFGSLQTIEWNTPGLTVEMPSVGVVTSVSTGGITEAPLDGRFYERQNATWAVDPIQEAPTDGKSYVRQSGTWTILPALLNWTANEQWTGRIWLDGRKVYQKTLSLGNLPSGGGSSIYPHNIVNLAMIVSHNGWSYNSANMTWLPIPNPQPGGAFSLMIGINNITVDAQAISGTYIGYLTLYYTCTDR